MCISTGPFELVEVVQVFRLTTVIFVTELTVMIKCVLSGYQSCPWEGCAKLFSFLLEFLKWLYAIDYIFEVIPHKNIWWGLKLGNCGRAVSRPSA